MDIYIYIVKRYDGEYKTRIRTTRCLRIEGENWRRMDDGAGIRGGVP